MNTNTAIRQVIDLLTAMLDTDDGYTFGDWVVKWFETYKKPKLKESTLESYSETIHKKLLVSKLAAVPLYKITGLDLQDFLLGIAAPNARKKTQILINSAMDKALRLQLITFNPCIAVELPSHKAVHYRPLEYAEQTKLIYYYEHPNEYFNYNSNVQIYYALFRFMCCTGLRIGEAMAMTFAGDVDRKRRIVIVNKSKSRNGNVLDSVKTENSVREVPFSKSLLPHIDTLKDYVKNGGEFTYRAVQQHFRKIYKRLNVKGANLHTFRHTFITLGYAVGIREKQIQQWAGHADMTTTMNIYTHILKPGTSVLLDYMRELKELTILDRK